VIVMRLFRDHIFLTQICENNLMLLKASPLLVAEVKSKKLFKRSTRFSIGGKTRWHFGTRALGLVRRAVTSNDLQMYSHDSPVYLDSTRRGV